MSGATLRRSIATCVLALTGAVFAGAQEPDSTSPRRIRARLDSIPVQGGVYNRPFLASIGRTAIAATMAASRRLAGARRPASQML